jgi:hypothetical protein
VRQSALNALIVALGPRIVIVSSSARQLVSWIAPVELGCLVDQPPLEAGALPVRVRR